MAPRLTTNVAAISREHPRDRMSFSFPESLAYGSVPDCQAF
jgi:hypothetical protein